MGGTILINREPYKVDACPFCGKFHTLSITPKERFAKRAGKTGSGAVRIQCSHCNLWMFEVGNFYEVTLDTLLQRWNSRT